MEDYKVGTIEILIYASVDLIAFDCLLESKLMVGHAIPIHR